ncbi:polymorphic toxin-type HINT domain-containing protein [Dactylosporangium sp. NPDC050688]|uniref:polymorphic toxin-type HINT domain-containing protein n=1 Tax=Dactylosporangium sp. NPDC050688 TaxID=3157217 RepID=UPI0033D30686
MDTGPSHRDNHDGNGGSNGSPPNNDFGVPGSDKNADKPKHETTDPESTKDPEKPAPQCHLHSFDPDTKVLMADGSVKAIKDIRIGDEVLATDPETGETRSQVVEATHHNLDEQFATLEVVDSEGAKATLQTTANHPFWNESVEQWQDAEDLVPGALLVGPDGATVRIDRSVVWTGAKYMRDLTVAWLHTYYVLAGDKPVLVHNNNGCDSDDDPGRPRRAEEGESLEDYRQQNLGVNAPRFVTEYTAPSGERYFGRTTPGGVRVDPDSLLDDMLGQHHGGCSEVCALNEAQNHGADIIGGSFVTMQTNSGRVVDPCPTCQALIGRRLFGTWK